MNAITTKLTFVAVLATSCNAALRLNHAAHSTRAETSLGQVQGANDGYYINSNGEETICPIGSMCAGGTAQPIICPGGSYSDKTGESMCTECPVTKACKGGSNISGCGSSKYYQNLVGQTECQIYDATPGHYIKERDQLEYECKSGYYCLGGYEPSRKCEPGSYGPSGVTGLTECEECPPGKYCKGGTHISKCASNTYKTNSGQSSCLVHNADEGYYVNEFDEQTICPVGYMCPGGDSQPIICPAGFYGDEIGLDECKSCPLGYQCNGGDDEPDICPSGFYGDEKEMPECKICPLGKTCQGGTDQPVICPAGFYGDEFGLDECKSCPPGKKCPNGGDEVIDCPSNTYQTRTEQTSCVKHNARQGYYINSLDEETICPLGYMCLGGDNEPIQCPDGFYTNGSGAKMCKLCPAGKQCLWDGDSLKPESCPAGQWSMTGFPKCISCPAPLTPHSTRTTCILDLPKFF